jgi:hypothetical protein
MAYCIHEGVSLPVIGAGKIADVTSTTAAGGVVEVDSVASPTCRPSASTSSISIVGFSDIPLVHVAVVDLLNQSLRRTKSDCVSLHRIERKSL